VSEAQTVKLRCARWRHLRSTVLCAGLLLLGACQTPSGTPTPPVPTEPSLPAVPPTAQATHYSIRSDLSDVRFLVYRAGSLTRLAHSHVVQPKTISGDIYLAMDFHRSSFSLVISVTEFQVDTADARSVEGKEFAELPDADAIAGTTRNMLGKNVLDSVQYPQIDIRSVALVGPAWGPDVTIHIKLRGAERDITVPVAIDYGNGQLVVTAFFEINQTDFGITPLSVLGGALQVANTVRVRMRIVAHKV
jgi:polyisoprenoid-binding protein YceI